MKRLVLSLVCVFLSANFTTTAPIPLPRPVKPKKPIPKLTHELLLGSWTMCWGGSPYGLTLGSFGVYKAESLSCTVVWHGTWKVDENQRFYFRESTTPEDASSYWEYSVEFSLDTMSGWAISKTGERGISVQLGRP